MKPKSLNNTNRVHIGPIWTQATITHNGWFVMVKDKETKGSAVPMDKIKSAELVIGIDIGEKQQIAIQRFTMNFNISTSPDAENNNNVAFMRYRELPKDIYYRIESITTYKNEVIREGMSNLKLKIIGE